MSELQLQFWNGVQYEPCLIESERGKAWRLCKPERALKPPKYRTRKQPAGSGTYAIDTKRGEYFAWARKAGLQTITDWLHRGKAFGFAYTRLVDKDLYFGVTIEECEEC